MKSPQNHRDIMRQLGLIQFFALLCPRLRTKTAFMSSKLRKSAGPFVWSSTDEQKFRELLEEVASAHMDGLTKLFDVNIAPKIVICHSDWAQSQNVSATILLVKYKTKAGEVKTEPAICESKQLSESYANKSSLLGELASLTTGILSLRCILEQTPFIVKTDSLSMTFLLAWQFDTKVVMDNKMFSRLVVVLQPFQFYCSYLPASSMQYSADAISRLELKVGKPIDRFLMDTPNFSDFELADTFLRPFRQAEDVKSFEDRNKRNVELIRTIETAKGLDEREIIELFSHTHRLPKRLHPSIQREITLIEQECENAKKSDPDLEYWKSSFGFQEPKGLSEIGVSQPRKLVENEEIIAANEVVLRELSDSDDLFDQTLAPNEVSCLTREGLNQLRQDTEWICNNHTYRDILYNPFDGIIPEAFARSSRELIHFVHEVNYIYQHALSTD